MRIKNIIIPILCFFLTANGNGPVLAQASPFATDFTRLLDSLDNRITMLEERIPELKRTRDASYYNVQRELDLTRFAKAYEEYVREEEMDHARELVESGLERARSRKDQFSVDFYSGYKDKVYKQIKQQRMFYQELLSREKRFKKVYHNMTKTGSLVSYQKASRMIQFALKYAEENNFQESARYLNNYLLYNEAILFDFQSSFDLVRLTSRPKYFEEAFKPLIESDSIENLRKAEDLLNNCMNYSRLNHTGLDSVYYAKQGHAIATTLSDMLSKVGRENELEKVIDQIVMARLDTLNPAGVFKWNDCIVVIDEFVPAASFENVRIGEAIIHADNRLAAYLAKNELCKSPKELKFGHAFIIPYASDVRNSSFFYDPSTRKWQYIACYTSVNSESYTRDVSRFMPPIYFDDIKEIARIN